jgi:uncharacterized protein YndB with AHSA1/START domain
MIEKTFSIEIEAPIGRVWEEITRTDGVQRGMFNCLMEAELSPGGRLRYRSVSGAHCFVWGETLEIEPPTRWVTTFAFSGMDEAMTRVEWTLEETGPGRTRVTVLHSGFPAENKTYKGVRKVWPQILGRFRDVLEKGDVSLGTRLKYGMMGATSFMVPSSMRSENVEKHIAERASRS